jgi:hypothetical protein
LNWLNSFWGKATFHNYNQLLFPDFLKNPKTGKFAIKKNQVKPILSIPISNVESKNEDINQSLISDEYF